jgi:zinc protease
MHITRYQLIRLTLAAVAVWAAATALAAAGTGFAHDTSDLKPDPAAKFGRFDNGLRYVIRPNAEPKGRASLRLAVLAGAFHEQEDQRGLAHFLEHLGFNGSEHYAPGTLIEFFQRMGMSFGGDTNASTGFDRTTYMIELPNTREETLAEGLRVLGDYAGGLLLLTEEIDKERGVILSEKRARDSVGFRTQMAMFEFMFGSTLLPKRMPIGLEEVIAKAPRERFTDFWNTWYRPEKMAVVVVGDIDVGQVEKQIGATFATLKARAPARAEPDLGQVTTFTGVRTMFHGEPEAPATNVTIQCTTPIAFEPDTAAHRLKLLPRRLAVAMLNRRLSVLAKAENAPFSQASASVSEYYHLARNASIGLTCKPEQWPAALAVGEQELRRALEHGFQAGELLEVVANFTNSLDQAVKTAPTRRSNGLANEIAGGLVDREVFTTPADEQALFKPALARVTPAECAAALRAAFEGNGRFVAVTGNVKIPGDAAAAITAAYETARAVAVKPSAAEAVATWAYTDFGAPGKVTKREHVADLDVTLVTFANGVRLNLKKTDFEAGRIRLHARVGYGGMTEPRGQRGLNSLAGGTFYSGGLGKHSIDDLRRVLAGKNVGFGFSTGSDAFEFAFPTAGPRGGGGGGTTREDLLLELQYVTAFLPDPGYRPEALRQARKSIEQMFIGFEHTPNGPLAMQIANLIAGGDPRFGVPPKEVLLARNFDELRAWLAPQFARGAIELALVGDLDIEAAIDAVAKTLGALPAREPRPKFDELRKVAFPTQPFAKDYTISSEIPKGLAVVYWPTSDAMEAKRSRRLSLLNSVLGDRLRVKIREEMGGTYSPSTRLSASDTYPGYGYIQASIDVDPAMAAKIVDAVIAQADDLATKGITADELERARKPMLTASRENLRNNGYWLTTVLARAQEQPERLDWARTRIADIESVTTEELSALARSYLGRDRASRATILPVKP